MTAAVLAQTNRSVPCALSSRLRRVNGGAHRPLAIWLQLVKGALLTGMSVVLLSAGCTIAQRPTAPKIQVFYVPSCTCCGRWVDHLRANGFQVQLTEVADTKPVKRQYGFPENVAACHTAQVEGYLVEGHVPAADIRRLLAQRPPIKGLAVPGMPHGAPGMEEANPIKYHTLAVAGDGELSVFATHEP